MTAQERRNDALPTSTARPSTTAETPDPAVARNASIIGSGPFRRPAATIARASGCSEASSTAAATRSTSSASSPVAAVTSMTDMRPVVTVPVLSSAMVSTRRVDSSTSGPVMRMPSWAPRPVPTMRAVGVASPSAQGQAMMSTATAAVNAACAEPPSTSHATRVMTEIPITTGTNTADTRSARRCTSALRDCASSTRRAIWASCVSDPTRVAFTTRRPPVLRVAPTTASPGETSTGTDSPVTRAASMLLVPEVTTPSVATFSPGRTMNSSPTRRDVIGTRISTPLRSTAASLAPSCRRVRRASPDRRLARTSAKRPARRNIVTPAATSR